MLIPDPRTSTQIDTFDGATCVVFVPQCDFRSLNRLQTSVSFAIPVIVEANHVPVEMRYSLQTAPAEFRAGRGRILV